MLSGRVSSSAQRKSDGVEKRRLDNVEVIERYRQSHQWWTYCVYELDNLGEPEQPGHSDHLE